MSKSKIYALLIGINEYDYFEEEAGEFNLDGCIKDSLAVADYLKETIANAPERLYISNLHSPKSKPKAEAVPTCAAETFAQATRKNMIKGFREFLTQATAADTVLIYFSGHGLTYDQPKELWHLTPEKRNKQKGQSLMCADSYTGEGKGFIPTLKDWDIRWLMHQIAGKETEQPHIVMLSDCCHSSGNTRGFRKEVGIKIRGISDLKLKNIPKNRSIDEFVFYQNSKKTKKLLKKHPERFSLPQVRHFSMSAAHHYELAKEVDFEEGRFGVFTYFLLKTLRATKGQVSYRDLIKIVRTKTIQKITFQTPQYYATETADADLLFLGGAVAQEATHFQVRPMDKKTKKDFKETIGIMDGGSLHGIPLETEGLTSIAFAPSANKENAIKYPRKGHLIKVGVHESLVQLEATTFPENIPFLKATITSTPIPKTKVFITTEGKISKTITKGVQLLAAILEDSPFLQVVQKPSAAHYLLVVYFLDGQEKYRITKIDQIKALVAPKIGFNETTAAIFVKEMELIARWERTYNLYNPHSTTIKAKDIELIAIDEDGEEWRDNLIELTATENHIPQLKLKVKLKNKKQVPLYCALIHLTSNYGIETSYLPPETHLGKKKYKDVDKKIKWQQLEVFALSHIKVNGQLHPTGLPFGFTISDEKFQQGITTTDDHFKLIVSTEQFDARHLYQGDLANPKGDRDFGSLPIHSALDALFQEVQTRKKKKKKKKKDNSAQADWWTSMLTVRTTRIA